MVMAQEDGVERAELATPDRGLVRLLRREPGARRVPGAEVIRRPGRIERRIREQACPGDLEEKRSGAQVGDLHPSIPMGCRASAGDVMPVLGRWLDFVGGSRWQPRRRPHPDPTGMTSRPVRFCRAPRSDRPASASPCVCDARRCTPRAMSAIAFEASVPRLRCFIAVVGAGSGCRRRACRRRSPGSRRAPACGSSTGRPTRALSPRPERP